MNETQQKQDRIQALLRKYNLDAVLLQRASSFAWATCGAESFINRAASNGAAALLITRTKRMVLTDNIETPRLGMEEKLIDQGWEFSTSPWHQASEGLESLSRGLKLGSDASFPGALDLSSEVAHIRAQLTPDENDRFRELGRRCALAMQQAIEGVKPGQTEYEIQALLAYAVERKGVQAIVNLVATDERVFNFRHPLPTSKKMERYAMLVLCGRRQGLVCSVTRLVHFGKVPPSLREKMEATAAVDAVFIHNTRPGVTLGEIFSKAQQAYQDVGFEGEWLLHHQGGPAGYEPREYLAFPGSQERVIVGQVYAWNPSITGTKSEDTILVGQTANEILTGRDGWPVLPVRVGETIIDRPAILEIT